MPKNEIAPVPGDALIVVDVQNDFLEGGSLAVREGEQVVPVLGKYLALFGSLGLPVWATRDWHPADHVSFRGRGGTWPPHCVQGTRGAAFAPGLRLPAGTPVVSKGDGKEDAYSGFQGTDLAGQLKARGVKRVFVGGLATDYCVRSTVLDALKRGFSAVVLVDAVRAVDVQDGDGERALQEMTAMGAKTSDYPALAG